MLHTVFLLVVPNLNGQPFTEHIFAGFFFFFSALATRVSRASRAVSVTTQPGFRLVWTVIFLFTSLDFGHLQPYVS